MFNKGKIDPQSDQRVRLEIRLHGRLKHHRRTNKKYKKKFCECEVIRAKRELDYVVKD